MNGLITTNLQDNEIVKAADLQIAGDNSIENMEKLFKVLVGAKKNVVIGGKLNAYVSGTILAAKIDPIMGYNIDTEEMFADHEGKVYMDGSDTVADYIIFSAADTSDRIDTVEVKAETIEASLQTRQFYNPDTESTSSSPTNIEKRKIVRVKVLKGTPGSSAAPSVEDGYVKLAEVLIPASVTELTDSYIRNITADIDEENTAWTVDKDSVVNPGSIQEIKDTFRNIHNTNGTLKNEVVKAANILLSGTGSLNGSNILKGGVTETVSETIVIDNNDSLATCINKIIQAISDYVTSTTDYIDNKEISEFDGIAEVTHGGTGAETVNGAQYNLIGNTPEKTDLELEENQMMYLENPNKSTENGSMLKIKLSKFRDWISSVIQVTKESIGLGNVDNTADADKSVKYATNAGKLNNKAEGSLSVSYASTANICNTFRAVNCGSSGSKTIDGITISSSGQTITVSGGTAILFIEKGSTLYLVGTKSNPSISKTNSSYSVWYLGKLQ